jgi:hypothetical protein
MTYSKYSDTTNSKVTYLLGAGASFNAVPIWGNQGRSMIEVGEELVKIIKLKFNKINSPGNNPEMYYLNSLANKIKKFGQKAIDFGSIDIYAKRLFLLNNEKELNDLKKCVSIYFDLWESGFMDCSKVEEKGKKKYESIDKRYFSLLSVLLEPGATSPCIHSNVSFITWNYDLQFEKAYETFLPEKEKSLSDLITKINGEDSGKKILHLNGYRGVFINQEEEFEIVDKSKFSSVEAYLKELIGNRDKLDAEENSFQVSIKYAWEMKSDSLERAKQIMKETNILVIIGYSFPAFNRVIDQALIKEFESGADYKRVIYQDPNANFDIVKSLFRNTGKAVELEKENTNQFYIPHEFLSPSKGEFFVI